MADARKPHPRARALLVTYVLLAVWFAAGAVGIGVVAGDFAATALGAALLSLGFVLGAAVSGGRGDRPSGRRFSRADGFFIAMCAAGASAAALVAITWLVVAGEMPVWAAAGVTVLAVASAGVALLRVAVR